MRLTAENVAGLYFPQDRQILVSLLNLRNKGPGVAEDVEIHVTIYADPRHYFIRRELNGEPSAAARARAAIPLIDRELLYFSHREETGARMGAGNVHPKSTRQIPLFWVANAKTLVEFVRGAEHDAVDDADHILAVAATYPRGAAPFALLLKVFVRYRVDLEVSGSNFSALCYSGVLAREISSVFTFTSDPGVTREGIDIRWITPLRHVARKYVERTAPKWSDGTGWAWDAFGYFG